MKASTQGPRVRDIPLPKTCILSWRLWPVHFCESYFVTGSVSPGCILHTTTKWARNADKMHGKIWPRLDSVSSTTYTIRAQSTAQYIYDGSWARVGSRKRFHVESCCEKTALCQRVAPEGNSALNIGSKLSCNVPHSKAKMLLQVVSNKLSRYMFLSYERRHLINTF